MLYILVECEKQGRKADCCLESRSFYVTIPAEPLFSRRSGTGLCPPLVLRTETTSQGQSCIRINPDHCGCFTDRATFPFLARAKLKEPLQVTLVTSILSLERQTSLPLSSVTLHPQDPAILWPRACDWELGLLIRDKTIGKSNKQQTNTITSSEVRAYPTPRGKEATESVTGFVFTALVQCLSTGDAGLGLILICAGRFDLTPLLRGRKAYIYIRHSRARDLHLLGYKSQCN